MAIDAQKSWSSATLVEWLGGGQEFALLDVREVSDIRAEGTLLSATSLTLSDLELRIATLVPRTATPIALIDGHGAEDGLANAVARRLAALGYTQVGILEGGTAAWQAAGNKLFPSPYVIGQAFGEFVEDHYDTPRVSAAQLQARLEAGEDLLILDSRTPEEYRAHSLPGSVNCPGAELTVRAPALVNSAETTIVIHCAGRTRSIMGAQALIDAGISNPIVALENGTMGWRLAGLPLAHDLAALAPEATTEALSDAAARAGKVSNRFQLAEIDEARFQQFLNERDDRTVYALDIRTPAEYLAGHHPEARSLPSWLAAPWISFHAATQNARIVLLDNEDGARAAATGSWLRRLGWAEVYVLKGPWTTVAKGVSDTPAAPLPNVPFIDGGLAQDLLSEGAATILDVASSASFVAAHIAGAFWSLRSQLPAVAASLPGEGLIIITAQDDRLSALAAHDLRALIARPVAILRGGTPRWQAEKRPVADGSAGMLSEAVDVFLSPWRDGENGFEAFREYLTWEKALAREIQEDSTLRFHHIP